MLQNSQMTLRAPWQIFRATNELTSGYVQDKVQMNGTVFPSAWTCFFAMTLRRFYPQTASAPAASIAIEVSVNGDITTDLLEPSRRR